VRLLGSQETFRKESNILKRLVKQYGHVEVERMLEGAYHLGWDSLRALGSAEGLGRRMALARYWQATKRSGPSLESIGKLLKDAGLT
jgi:hypothetical protein